MLNRKAFLVFRIVGQVYSFQTPIPKFDHGLLVLPKTRTMSSTIPKEVFGNWKDYTIKPASLSDFEKIAEHIRIFFLTYEKMNQLLGHEDVNGKDHDRLVRIALRHQLSFLVTKKDSPEVCGVNLIMDNRKAGFGFVDFTPTSVNLAKIFALMDKLDDSTHEILNKNFKTQQLAQFTITSVDDNLKGRGIGHEMYKRGLVFLKEKGFQTVIATSTGVGTQTITKKLAFQELGRIVYKDYVDANGEKVFNNSTDDSYCVEMAIAL